MSGRTRSLSGALVFLSAASGTAWGQDIEAAARITGRPLPPQYYERVRERPSFFELAQGWRIRAQQNYESGQAVTGTLPMVVVQSLFLDSPEPAFSARDILQTLFDGPSAHGTVSEYYSEVSGGRFTVGGHVLDWVRTDVTLDETVGPSFGLGEGAKTGEYLVQALTKVDDAIDFGQFDNDGPDGTPNSDDDDGVVDAVAFQFLEVSASCGGPGIWPHRGRIEGWVGSPFATNDTRPSGKPITVNDYIIQSTVTCDGTALATASTIAHELGHVLGLPDLYDRSLGLLPEQRRWVVGCWSLMAAGAWGCGNVERVTWVRPTHMGAWEKSRLGWLSDERVVENVLFQELTLGPVRETGQAIRIPLTSTELFLVEYRTQAGFDLDLPASGVLIFHVDDDPDPPACETCPRTYRVALEEADGNGTLQRPATAGGNRGEAGDAFGVIAPDQFTSTTTPSTRTNGGNRTGVTIHDIRIVDGVAALLVSTAMVAADRLLQSLLESDTAPLSARERAGLDRAGNANGRYDIGDLRQYLQDNSSIMGAGSAGR